MRILVGITAFLPSSIYGGPATVAFNHARELVVRGHEVTIVTSDVMSFRPERHYNDSIVFIDGVEVRYFPTYIAAPKFPFLISRKLNAWVRGALPNFDVVHVHFARDWIPLSITREALLAGKRVFLQPHGMLSRRNGVRTLLDHLIISRLLKEAEGVLVLQSVDEDIVHGIAPAANCLRIPNGIQIRNVRTRWDPRNLDRKTALYLARLHPHKRPLDFIEAAKILELRGSEYHFRIVGPDEGELGNALEKVKANGMNDVVTFVGPVDANDALEEFSSASVYVLPSINEQFPMSVLEAMAVGIPTIVTDGVYIKDMLLEHEAAVVVSSNPESIAEAIEKVIEDKAFAMKLSMNARRMVESELTLEAVVDRLEEIYRYE